MKSYSRTQQLISVVTAKINDTVHPCWTSFVLSFVPVVLEGTSHRLCTQNSLQRTTVFRIAPEDPLFFPLICCVLGPHKIVKIKGTGHYYLK